VKAETPKRTAVLWDEAQAVALRAFGIWEGQPELTWGKRAWHVLADSGLTSYRNEIERYEVFFRLLVLGGIYSDFCDAAWEERSEPQYAYWAEPLDLSPFMLDQLCARLLDWELKEDEIDTLEMLVENERNRVVDRLMVAFGGPSRLYASLWNSRRTKERECDDDDTHDPEGSQMAAYSWVEAGCRRYR